MMARWRSPLPTTLVAVGPVVLALAISMLVIRMAGGPPIDAMRALWSGAVGGPAQLATTLHYVLPLSLVALGWIVAFSTRRINIGFEGQLVVGGLAAAVAGLHIGGLPSIPHLALATLVAAVAGGAYAGVAAWLWARRDVDEIIATLLLNFIALELAGWLVRGPLQEPDVIFPRSEVMRPTALWPAIIPHSALTWDILLVPLLAIGVWFLLHRTSFGASMRITGANRQAARYAGMPTVRINVVALVMSGALAGLAGSSLVLGGESGRLSDGFSAGLGFDGIVVALVARNRPAGVIPSALLFAVLRSGGGLMETRVGVSSELVLITQGLVIVMVAGAGFLFDRFRTQRMEPPGDRSGDAMTSPSTAEVA